MKFRDVLKPYVDGMKATWASMTWTDKVAAGVIAVCFSVVGFGLCRALS